MEREYAGEVWQDVCAVVYHLRTEEHAPLCGLQTREESGDEMRDKAIISSLRTSTLRYYTMPCMAPTAARSRTSARFTQLMLPTPTPRQSEINITTESDPWYTKHKVTFPMRIVSHSSYVLQRKVTLSTPNTRLLFPCILFPVPPVMYRWPLLVQTR